MARAKKYMDAQSKTDIRDGMRIDWDVPIPMDDGIVLRCLTSAPLGRIEVIA